MTAKSYHYHNCQMWECIWMSFWEWIQRSLWTKRLLRGRCYISSSTILKSPYLLNRLINWQLIWLLVTIALLRQCADEMNCFLRNGKVALYLVTYLHQSISQTSKSQLVIGIKIICWKVSNHNCISLLLLVVKWIQTRFSTVRQGSTVYSIWWNCMLIETLQHIRE